MRSIAIIIVVILEVVVVVYEKRFFVLFLFCFNEMEKHAAQ